MDFFSYFHNIISNILLDLSKELAVPLKEEELQFTTEAPKNEAHGDLSTNVAMLFYKRFAKKPTELGVLIQKKLEDFTEIASVNVVNPGFINIKLKESYIQNYLGTILNKGLSFAKANIGNNEKVNIEYVSANPTGPLHIGHARGAIVGDILVNLYKFFGYSVHKEYYINDAGRQINVLGKSLYFRYLELFNKAEGFEKGEDFYPGEYLITTAKKLVAKDGDKWLQETPKAYLEYMNSFALQDMMLLIKEDLKQLDVNHDFFASEKGIVTDEKYAEVLKILKSRDLLYLGTLTPPKGKVMENFTIREQKLFRSSAFGDDTDRALEKSNGERTYFANDVVYHFDKIQRGATKLIDILGADHIGYFKRIAGAVLALSNNKTTLNVVSCQLINLLDNGIPLKMSKRAGNFVTLKDLINAVGKDICRFIMITRKNDVSLDFDLSKVKEQSSDNPLFYIQYAYARIQSVLRNALEVITYDPKVINIDALKELQSADEIALIKTVMSLPKSLQTALQNNDPHRVYIYLHDISKKFHHLWNSGKEDETKRFIIKDNQILTIARLQLLQAVSISIKIGVDILGVNIKESM